MEEAKALIRTAVRTFFNEPKQILIIDALMLHGVLHLEDIHDLLGIQTKEARHHMTPLKDLRFCTMHSRQEHSIKVNREVKREYYWCKFSDAVNVIKYRIITLRADVTLEYQSKAGPDFWECPRCKNTYKELDITPSGPGADMLCLRCGAELEINPAVTQDKDSHEGIMRLNEQLSKFNTLIAAVDMKIASGAFKEPTFDEAFARRKKVPTSISGRATDNYVEVRRGRERDKAAGAVNEDDININLTSAAALSKEEAASEADRKRRIAEGSLLPEWHTGAAPRDGTLDIRGNVSRPQPNGTTPTAASSSVAIKPEDEDEKKPTLLTTTTAAATDTKPPIPSAPSTPQPPKTEQDLIMDRYMLDMQREQAEADRKRLQEAEEEEDSSEDEFEDVVATPLSSQDNTRGVNTPVPLAKLLGSQQINGVKREFEDDSSEAATPMSISAPEVKKPRLDVGGGGEEESDEEEFEDV